MNLDLLGTFEPLIKVFKLLAIITFKEFLHFKSSLKTFFKLESNEHRYWSAPFFEVTFLQFVDFGINFTHFVPVISDDIRTSLTKETNQFRGVISK